MTLHHVRLKDVPPASWRNGGGQTRELLAWPAAGWAVRISVATIAADGPFSAYPGMQRWFAVLDGAGVALRFGADRVLRCTPQTPPLAFDGADAPGCELVGGATQDLNLMVRATAGHGRMRAAADPLAPCTFRAVYCAEPAVLRCWAAAAVPLDAGTLAWSAEAGDGSLWQLDAAGGRCWWLTFEAHRAADALPAAGRTAESTVSSPA